MENSDKKKVSLEKTSVVVGAIAVVLVIGLLTYICVTGNISKQQTRMAEKVYTVMGVACREIENPDAPIGIIKEYTYTIDTELEKDTTLAFYTVHQMVDVYIDGEKVYSLKPSEHISITEDVGSNWVMIPIHGSDAGKEVKIVITPVYESFRNRKIEFLMGSSLAVYSERLLKDMPQLILSVIAVFVGFIFILMAVISILRKHYGMKLVNLGVFSVMMGVWRLTDTRFTPFLMPDKSVFLYYCTQVMLMLGIIPLMKAVKDKFKKVSQCIMDVYCIMTALVCIFQIVLDITGIMDFRESLTMTHVVIVSGAIILIGVNIYEFVRYPKKIKKHTMTKLPLICVIGVLADTAAYYIKGNSSGLLFSLLTLIIYVIAMGINVMINYGEQEKQLMKKDLLLAETDRKLAESRISTMISQIQPHFIYNTLGTIEQLCMDEPESAASLVHNFSLYLRGNFTELNNPAPISISKEMEHVKNYVSIELVRFPDIQVKYDLRASEFMIPALSVQPLVENAIKHGLMGLESGGCVEISTYETEKAYYVKVTDDGVGFDKNNVLKNKKHIGISNIRGRIQVISHGTLTIESTVGIGTTALITIPKEVTE
ncbi:MAG: histidine kinase [Clostridia bacterium]|nr:histidine kinase [Clostridia bacterium]